MPLTQPPVVWSNPYTDPLPETRALQPGQRCGLCATTSAEEYAKCDQHICFPQPIPPTFTAPRALIPTFEAIQKLKAASVECGFDDPDRSAQLWAHAKALSETDAVEVEDPLL